jgi:hypothetical protein
MNNELSKFIVNTFEKYKNPTLIKEIEITHSSYMKLNKLKKSSPEAYYYWVKALNINDLYH